MGVTAVCRRMPGHSHPQDKPDASAPSQAEGIPPEGSSNGASSSSGSSSSGGSTSTTTVQAGMGSEKIVGSERADLQIPKVRGSARAVRGGRRAGCAGDPWVPSTPLDAQPIGLPAVHKVLWVSPVCCQLHMTAAPVAQEVVEKLRYQVFGYDTLWVTSVDNYQESGVVFKGNLRTKDPAVAYERMREKLKVRRAARTDTRTLPALERSEEARTSLRRCRRPQRVTQAQGDTLPPGPTPHPHTTQAWGHMHAACLVRVCWVMSGRCSCWRTRTRSPRRWCCRPPRARGSSAGSPRWAQWPLDRGPRRLGSRVSGLLPAFAARAVLVPTCCTPRPPPCLPASDLAGGAVCVAGSNHEPEQRRRAAHILPGGAIPHRHQRSGGSTATHVGVTLPHRPAGCQAASGCVQALGIHTQSAASTAPPPP